MISNIKLGFIMVLLILVVIFTLQNADTVSIRFFTLDLEASRALVLISTLAAGVLIGWLLGSWGRLKDSVMPKEDSDAGESASGGGE